MLSSMDKRTDSRIRYFARRDDLVAIKRRRRWYFADYTNLLVSPEHGLNDDEALAFLADTLASSMAEVSG